MGLLEKFEQIQASKKAVAPVELSKPIEPVSSVKPEAHFQNFAEKDQLPATDSKQLIMSKAYQRMPDSLPAANNADAEPTSQELAAFKSRARKAAALAELKVVLQEFSQHGWTLVERCRMSISFTPRAVRLIELENADKYQTLEELSALCYQR